MARGAGDATTGAAEQAQARPEQKNHDPRPLHLVKRGQHPRALCGAIVTDPWDPHRPTAWREGVN